MSRIRGKDTRPEILVRKFLYSNGFRYRIHVKTLPGSPDIVLKKYRTIIFVNGCFWHGHTGCKDFVIPKTRTAWWLKKISRTQEKDKHNQMTLSEAKWNVIVIWECELKKSNRSARLIKLMDEILFNTRLLHPIDLEPSI